MEASREILWNIDSMLNQVAMYFFMLIALLIAFVGVFRHIELWLSGKESKNIKFSLINFVKGIFIDAGLQKKVIKEKTRGFAHSLVYLGFIVLLFTTTMVFIDHDLGIKVYKGNFYLMTTLFSDLFGLFLIIGCLILAYRRYILKPDALHSSKADSLFLIFLVLLCIQGFLLEGLRIHVTNDPWQNYSPVGLLIAKFFWFLSESSARWLHYMIWWFHTLSVFSLIALLPYSKFFHALVSPLNLIFKYSSNTSSLSYPGNIEKIIEEEEDFTLGSDSIKDYSWKALIDLDSCTSCGRCQDVCPAYRSEKPLSPKWLILDTRNHALELNSNGKITKTILPSFLNKIDKFLTKNVYLNLSKTHNRGKNQKTSSAKNIGLDINHSIAGDVMDKDVFWSCTTCGACVEACPVGINHVEQISENRRNMVLMKGDVPNEAQKSLRDLETRYNPYTDNSARSDWADGLNIKILKEGDSVDILYWVGCISSFDKRKQEIAKSLVKILNKANISFGILGEKECCTGDSARRLGEENLFQTLAKKNIATLNSINFNKILVTCPHCLNTFKNEYPDIETFNKKIIHHSEFILDLIESKKIHIKENKEDITFHDPCYLGRYNKQYDAPRKSLKSIGLNIIEMKDNKEKSLCCGAGGGHFWFDMKKGERINKLRVKQVEDINVKQVATACPFCHQMLEDGKKLLDREDISIRDIAEIVAESLK